MVPVGVLDRKSPRNVEILRLFCDGMEPSAIDSCMKLKNGTSRNVISAWWLDEKLTRGGGVEFLFGSESRRRENW